MDTASKIERGVNGTRIEVTYLIAIELGFSLSDLFAFGAKQASSGATFRDAIRPMLDLLESCDDDPVGTLTNLVRIGLTLTTR